VSYPNDRLYAAIIGESPSKGARSPYLWNACFKELKIDAEMLSFDVSESQLTNLFKTLEQDPLFIGGAIAFSYKEKITQLLGSRISPEAKLIGAVNCLYRNSEGNLFGTNTDGEASLFAFENCFGSIEGKNCLLMGLGGVGKAVAVYFSRKINVSHKNFHQLKIVNRKLIDKNFLKMIGSTAIFDWQQVNLALTNVDIIINCTSLGNINTPNQSPLSLDQIKRLSLNTIIYDINYQPNQSLLLKYANSCGVKTLSGKLMNVEQAISSFKYALKRYAPLLDESLIREIMNNVTPST
jgi:shikimate dehydrogenase